MVDTSTGIAPKRTSRSRRSSERSWVLGTRTRHPKSGLTSNHAMRSRWVTTSPTTTTPGPACLAFLTSVATSSSVVMMERCSTVVPPRVMIIGVSPGRPAVISALAIAGAASAPSGTTTVTRSRPSGVQSTSGSDALTTCTSRLRRPVRPSPAYAGTATAVLTPGAISKGTLALRRAADSTARDPSNTGSPARRRTVR